MLVISEYSPQLKPSASANDLRKMTETASLIGLSVYYIPQHFEEISVEEGLWHIPTYSSPETAIWVGYIPTPIHYQTVYDILLQKNIRLINNPDEFRQAEEFDKYYPFVSDLTARSFVVENIEEALMAANSLHFPVFLKGTIQSLKKSGWKACVAENETELVNLFSNLQKQLSCSLGKVIIRELIPLRYEKTTPAGFPQGREYRIFLLHGKVLAYSYYWDKDDPLTNVSPEEEKSILSIAQIAAKRINTPYLTIDIGQKNSGEWIMIEAGDAQFSGICQISPVLLWQKITQDMILFKK